MCNLHTIYNPFYINSLSASKCTVVKPSLASVLEHPHHFTRVHVPTCSHSQFLSPQPLICFLSLYIPFHKWNPAICNLFYLASFHKHAFEIHPCCSCIGSLFLFTVFSFLHGYTISLFIHQLMNTWTVFSLGQLLMLL